MRRRSATGGRSHGAAGRSGRRGRRGRGRRAGLAAPSGRGLRLRAPGGGRLRRGAPGSRGGRGGSLGLGSLGGSGCGLLTSAVVGAVIEPPTSGDDTCAQVGEILEETLGEVKTVLGTSHALQYRKRQVQM